MMKDVPESPLIIEDPFVAAGVAVLSGEKPRLQSSSPNRVVFLFNPSDEVFQALGNYSSRGTGPLLDYATVFRGIRRQMYEMLDGQSGVSTYHDPELRK